jgi:glycosyltransferase involved in cell wall biosynthesis
MWAGQAMPDGVAAPRIAIPPATAGASAPDDVCLLVEGTYPYVAGGVSAWVHDIINGHPELKFSVFNIGSSVGSYGPPRYVLPDHVTRLHQTYCSEAALTPPSGPARTRLDAEIRAQSGSRPSHLAPSRVLGAIRRLNVEDGVVDDRLLEDLVCGDLSVGELLHGRETFDLLGEIAEKVTPQVSFLDLFWHFRAIYVPILRLLAVPAPAAGCYHAVSTGYAGLCGAAFSLRTGRPLIVTEHGIYSRERNMDLARASWIKDHAGAADGIAVGATQSPLRGLWSRSFRALSQLAYRRASSIVTLSDVNRARQIADGAPAAKISIVPNGVDVPPPDEGGDERGRPAPDARRPLRVGFVGRVVPIKDVITFIWACHLAMAEVELDVRIIGPMGEDAAYARRCLALVETLGLTSSVKFVGPQPANLIYGELDVVVLTSFSEGQPLVILEGYAAGLPAIATDVGACREMIEGRSAADRLLGPSGLVTRVGTPSETAAALVRLAREPALRRRLGAAGRKRVLAFYRRKDMIESYRELYRDMVTR